MNKQCEIVQDLLPLYVDGACSEASEEMIKEHLETCADCRAIYEQMCSHTNEDILQSEKDSVVNTDMIPLDNNGSYALYYDENYESLYNVLDRTNRNN